MCYGLSIEAVQQRLKLLPAWFQTLPHGELVQPVNTPADQSTDQRKSRQPYDYSQPGKTRLPDYRKNESTQANLDRQQIPPKDVSQQPNLVVHLNQ
jgi:hypothetical protein